MTGVPALDWARSGLMALTGPARAAPLVPEFDASGAIQGLLDDFARATGRSVAAVGLDARLLTERAYLMRLSRGGVQSCNRTCRLIEARDGWLAVNLPRPSDVELLLPWLGLDLAGPSWPRIERAIAARDLDDLLGAAADLPLAVAAAGLQPPPCTTWAPAPEEAPSQADRAEPIVLDLSALWAGPLCGQLLHIAGARVIKVESLARREASRERWPRVFDCLNAGKESVALDFADAGQLRILRSLLASADIVIGSARPRAFDQLGIDPQQFLAARPRLVWVAITAHGWYGDAGHRVGFGDDAAAAAGLLAIAPDGRPAFVGDAIADPLTGVAAATRAWCAWRAGRGGLIDVSLRATAARIAAAPRLHPGQRGELRRRAGDWWLRVGHREGRVAPPSPRRATGRAAPFGADTRRIVEEFT